MIKAKQMESVHDAKQKKDNSLQYQYVFFNATDGHLLRYDVNGYYYICALDLKNTPNVHLVSCLLEEENAVVRFLFSIHNSRRINRYIRLPFKKIWYPKYFNETHLASIGKPICFVLNNFQIPYNYMLYLKDKYPRARFVKIHRDLSKLFYERYPEYSKAACDRLFDISFTYDYGEAKQNGWKYFDEFESKTDIHPQNGSENNYVFFAGRAKDRLKKLLDVYDRLTQQGITCYFYITGVPEEQRVTLPGVIFADSNMPYREMLERTVNSACVLDINQGGALGYTSRFLESVMYNKKLLTDNPYIKTNKYFDPKYIQLFDNPSEIDPNFIKESSVNVNYHYSGEFSPVNLIYAIDKALVKQK